MELTDEQLNLIDLALEGKNVLVNACIGSGKTTTIQALCDELPDDRDILYLTYNKLLKLDAKKKISNWNVTVQNYHGFAFNCLRESDIKCAQSQLIKSFIENKVHIPHIDVLILDEYQDIDKEISELLLKIKHRNPKMQIIVVGDMDQKIYDWTTLNVEEFINEFLGEHEELIFTKCFRLSKDYARMIGDAWEKEINGVNPETEIIELNDFREAVARMILLKPKEILCLGQRNGSMALALNELEACAPDRFNKKTVYASIMDNGDTGSVSPNSNCAIFTTFDGSKGMERDYCFIFDYSLSYWFVRKSKANAKTKILKNIFLVAASRGKKKIYFVRTGNEGLLSFEDLKGFEEEENTDYSNIIFDASEMFSFKYKEDVEKCFNMLKIDEIFSSNHEEIITPSSDGLIDLSPVIGIYQQAIFFDKFNIDNLIAFSKIVHSERTIRSGKLSSVEKKVLALVASTTAQERYLNQVDIPFIQKGTVNQLKRRLAMTFTGNENVEKTLRMELIINDKESINIAGRIDVEKGEDVYELKFVSELSHEHFLQCAMYSLMHNYKNAYVWNVKHNRLYKVSVPDTVAFLTQVLKTITKGKITKFKSIQTEAF